MHQQAKDPVLAGPRRLKLSHFVRVTLAQSLILLGKATGPKYGRLLRDNCTCQTKKHPSLTLYLSLAISLTLPTPAPIHSPLHDMITTPLDMIDLDGDRPRVNERRDAMGARGKPTWNGPETSAPLSPEDLQTGCRYESVANANATEHAIRQGRLSKDSSSVVPHPTPPVRNVS